MSENGPKLAMFGGGGFIGANLAYHLQSTGDFTPLVYDKVDDKLRLRCGDQPFQFVRCDIVKDADLIDRSVAECDVAVNLAAHVHPKKFIRSPREIVQLNLFDSLNVVDACVRHRRRLIHFSTCEVYGKTGGRAEPFREDETDCIVGPIVNHRWIYSSAKQLLDRIIHAHALEGNLEYTILRPFNFVGPLMDWLMPSAEAGCPRVLAQFTSALMFGRPLQLVGGGHSLRCFTYIDDATTAIEAVLRNLPETRNHIINIGNPDNETTIRDLAHLMRDIYRRRFDPACDVPILDVDGVEFYGPGYEDCDRRLPDISKIQRLGWSPRFGLEETFERSMQYFVTHREPLLAEA